jgi:c-di-GMP-binding flagellar brake protein YcgR
VHVLLESHITTPAGPIRGHLLDLSASGAFVSTPRALPVGTGVRLSIARGDDRNPLQFDAEVVRIGDPSEGRLAGLGLRFIGVTPLEASLLDAMLTTAA